MEIFNEIRRLMENSIKNFHFFLILPKPIEEQMISSSSQPAKEK